ncbi:TPA: hypothetical protein ROY17_005349 [Bacillus thuringiensis]|nr:hypothetical protein [Bacillus thuringiensis]
MIALQRVKKIAAGFTIGFVSLSFLLSPAFAASWNSDSSQERSNIQYGIRDHYKSIPEKTLTVLIAVDEQFRKNIRIGNPIQKISRRGDKRF